jgi:hypothetical protein
VLPFVKIIIPPVAPKDPTRSSIHPRGPHVLRKMERSKMPAADMISPTMTAVRGDGIRAKAPPAVAIAPKPTMMLNAREPVSSVADFFNFAYSSVEMRRSAKSLSMSRTTFMRVL